VDFAVFSLASPLVIGLEDLQSETISVKL